MLTSLQVKSDESETDWMLAGYIAPNIVDVIATGSGGAREMLCYLSDDKIYFGAFRSDTAGRTKFIGVCIIGKDVGGIARGKGTSNVMNHFNLFFLYFPYL